jgi:hypothetical protein
VGIRIVGVSLARSPFDGTIDDEWAHNNTTINGRKAVSYLLNEIALRIVRAIRATIPE